MSLGRDLIDDEYLLILFFGKLIACFAVFYGLTLARRGLIAPFASIGL